MSRSAHHKNARRAGVAVAGIIAAALATGGVEAASAAGAPVPHLNLTSGVIFACYSNTTKALSETTKAAGCKTGFTELSWNARGPPGRPGCPGTARRAGRQGRYRPAGTHRTAGRYGPAGSHGAAGARWPTGAARGDR